MSRKTSPYVIDAVEEFLTTKRPREPKTHAAYSGILLGSDRGTKKPLGVPFAPCFQNRRFHTITPNEVAVWFAQRVKGGQQATKHRISKNARAFLRYAREQGYTTLDLAAAIDVYQPGGPRVDWLSWSQVHKLLDAVPDFRFRMAAAWLFYTGCRVGEATSAKQSEIRLQGNLYQWTVPKPKTHVPRLVWLPDALTSYIEQSRAVDGLRPEWPLLWDCEGRGFSRKENRASPITSKTINNVLDRARDTCGLPFAITNHVAKHSYCTNWIKQQGSDEIQMVKLSRQVGTSVEVLRKTYIHIDLDEDDFADIRSFGSRAA